MRKIKVFMKNKENRMNKRGFTLAELLIVVAIIGVLVAISIPVFNGQLEKSRQATAMANLRAAYAEAAAAYITDDYSSDSVSIGYETATVTTVEVAHVNIPTYLGPTDINGASFPFTWDINTPALENEDATVQFSFSTDGTVSAKCKGVSHSG